ncbi:MAG: hypothetical protein HC879_17255 [Leptolyngbyaceae cyanobacterium SL_5_9]|nr:hypothetical protein [Leptolyngbyaceae cyanobacterium SL_5_9]NJO76855.1 hypothetical protein [Leptolyngbyaceae cyanobacterium RM1_406_9]
MNANKRRYLIVISIQLVEGWGRSHSPDTGLANYNQDTRNPVAHHE